MSPAATMTARRRRDPTGNPGPTTPGITFRLLGPIEVAMGPLVVTPRAHKIRLLLAGLLVRANTAVPIEALIQILWGDNPPRTALQATRVYVSQVRQLFAKSAGGGPALATLPAGYRLDIDETGLDVLEFQRRCALAGELNASGRFEFAAEQYRAAIDLWRGPALADVRTSSVLERTAVRLEEAYLAARERRIDLELRLHRHLDLVSELSALIAEHPFNESLHARLMIALYRSGRTSDALFVYRNLRDTLIEELGVEPCPQLRSVHQAVLASDRDALERHDLWTL